METARRTVQLVPKAQSGEKCCCCICHMFEAKQCESAVITIPLMHYAIKTGNRS